MVDDVIPSLLIHVDSHHFHTPSLVRDGRVCGLLSDRCHVPLMYHERSLVPGAVSASCGGDRREENTCLQYCLKPTNR
jgi:hypothetical protein